jgi:hypothetical protein
MNSSRAAAPPEQGSTAATKQPAALRCAVRAWDWHAFSCTQSLPCAFCQHQHVTYGQIQGAQEATQQDLQQAAAQQQQQHQLEVLMAATAPLQVLVAA